MYPARLRRLALRGENFLSFRETIHERPCDQALISCMAKMSAPSDIIARDVDITASLGRNN